MNYKKEYKEALERAKNVLNGNAIGEHGTSIPEYIFPVLKESKDEKIRNVITLIIKDIRANVFEEKGISKEDAITWLENKDEQNLAWSKEDESKIKSICRLLKTRFYKDTCDEVGFTCDKMCDYLISLKNKIQPQWKPSEEQLTILLNASNGNYMSAYYKSVLSELYRNLRTL